jgi:hypothetical protein
MVGRNKIKQKESARKKATKDHFDDNLEEFIMASERIKESEIEKSKRGKELEKYNGG